MVGGAGQGGAVRERLAWVDTTRGLGVLAVVVFHVLIWNYSGLVDGTSAVAAAWEQVGSSLGRIRMPILFALSGLLAHRGLLLGWRVGTARLRLVSNAYLYVVWVVVYGGVFALLARPDFPHSIDTLAQFALQFVFPTTTLWFIFALGLYPLVLVGLRALRVPWWGVLLLGAAAWFVGANLRVILFGDALLQNFVFFALGVLGAEQLRRFSRPGLVTFAAPLGVFLLAVLGGHLVDGPAAEVLGFVASAAAIPLAVVSAALLCLWGPAARLGSAIGRRTLPIYLLQVPLLGLWSLVANPEAEWLVALLRNPLAELAYPPLVTAGIIALSLGIRGLLARVPGDPLFTVPPVLVALARPTRRGRHA
ncbi:acyltransferase family protein [Rathayibacter sp. VKM Ac-2754]|uniref:acyltransferase family protein n=1 Tax=Rathayibacter sp. VKM Ac-2754 TaxID=2609251 RepID=UPI00135CD96B|nr:acyltransferase [Rathayibacter sp. VKM Ac-2754]MWV59990.1 acyltransferase family protein [Rathayibacter sp. VKM Ac-2754]